MLKLFCSCTQRRVIVATGSQRAAPQTGTAGATFSATSCSTMMSSCPRPLPSPASPHPALYVVTALPPLPVHLSATAPSIPESALEILNTFWSMCRTWP